MLLPNRSLPVDIYDLPQTEARALLRQNIPVYLPVNPIEYHGPHLPLRNDHLMAIALAADLHARLAPREGMWPFLCAPSIDAGVDPCPGPGTRAVSYRDVKQLVEDACASLFELGARRVVIATFHGAPIHAMAADAGVRLLEARGARAIQPFNLLMNDMLTADPTSYAEAFAHVEDPDERAAMMRELPTDFHAGFAETSVALHYAPDAVSDIYKTLPPCPSMKPDPAFTAASQAARALGRERLALELDFAGAGRGWAKLRPFPGYTGRPHRACAAAGKYFVGRLLDEYTATTRAVFDGAPSPRPIMPWLLPLTLGGLIPTLSVPLRAVKRFWE